MPESALGEAVCQSGLPLGVIRWYLQLKGESVAFPQGGGGVVAIYRVRGICWAGEGQGVLPSEAVVQCAGPNDIADALSDTHGWLVEDFEIYEDL
ncbi:hypothetical protein BCL79_0769 [Stenotrophomonas rhizophila]|uniref:Uncharacterized protein n=2 Tax=Stenotrophomonas rhizophila TaxID=216778 RepID=A0A498CH93_9GAMM|nr:hypothetical protein BCL79_0769 [Stenotrophomonas rhizophila]